MHTFKQMNPQSHKCQIDCTNHDEVINKLQIKSKDLYYFWRNYQWLYNKYYNQPKKVDTKEYDQKINSYKQKIQQYEDELNDYDRKYKQLQRANQSLQNQNKTLQNENNSLSNQIRTFQNQITSLTLQITSLNKDISKKKEIVPQIEQEYKRQILRLRNKVQNYKDIEINFSNELQDSRRKIISLQRQMQNERGQNLNKIRRYQNEMKLLQDRFDRLRLQIANQPVPTKFITSQQSQQQEQKFNKSFNKIKLQAQKIISTQFQNTKMQLKQQFNNIIYNLTPQQLQSILVFKY